MKQLVRSLVLALLCVSAAYAGPNATAQIVVSLNRDSGFVKGDQIKLTITVKNGSQVTGFDAEVLYDSTAVSYYGFLGRLYQLYVDPNYYYRYRPITGIAGFNTRAEVSGDQASFFLLLSPKQEMLISLVSIF